MYSLIKGQLSIQKDRIEILVSCSKSKLGLKKETELSSMEKHMYSMCFYGIIF